MVKVSRGQFLGLGAGAVVAPAIVAGQDKILGSGAYRYRVVTGWGVLDKATPVKNCHGIVCTEDQRIVLLTDDARNNVIVYDSQGRLVDKWGTRYVGAHGLSLVQEGDEERLFITDNRQGLVVKTTLSGDVLNEWRLEANLRQYPNDKGYRPAWTLHADDGAFVVLDGYGKDYFHLYDASGVFDRLLGGKEGGISHWGPHGGMIEPWQGKQTMLIAMSDQRCLIRLGMGGERLATYPMPGGNPRQIRPFGEGYLVAHLADNWPKDRNSRGFVSVLDQDFRVVANLAGAEPVYDKAGLLQKMRSVGDTFIHPHDAVVDAAGSIYVAQFASGNTYPIKLERI